MPPVLPSAREMRTLYVLSADKIWFSLAVVMCLMVAGELSERVTPQAVPFHEDNLSL